MMFNEVLQRELDKLSNDGELTIQFQSKSEDGVITTKRISTLLTTHELFEVLVLANDDKANIWEVA